MALSPAAGPYRYNDAVTFTPTVANGYALKATGRWTITPSTATVVSGCTDAATACQVRIVGNTTVTANLDQIFTVSGLASPAAGATMALSPAAGPYRYNDAVTFTPTVANGYALKATGRWTITPSTATVVSGCTDTTTTCQVRISDNTTVTANLDQLSYTVSGFASPAAGATMALSPDAGPYRYNDAVTFTPTVANGYALKASGRWTITPSTATIVSGCTDAATACQVRIVGNTTVTANLDPLSYPLTLTSISNLATLSATIANPANGTITTCTNARISAIPHGCKVTITAGIANSHTASWSGGGCTGDAATACVIESMTAPATVAVNTRVRTFALTVVQPSGGAGTITANILASPATPAGATCPGSPLNAIPYACNVSMTATSANGFAQFPAWQSTCTNGGNRITCNPSNNGTNYNMLSDMTISANFTRLTYQLTLNHIPSRGTLTVNVQNPRNETFCTNSSTTTIPFGCLVNVQATPQSGFANGQWSGPCSGTTGTACDFTMDGAKTVGATFLSTDAALSSLNLQGYSCCTDTWTFSPDTLAYNIKTTSSGASISASARSTDPVTMRLIKARSTTSLPFGVNFNEGLNTFNIEVTAQDGVTKRTYQLTVNRASKFGVNVGGLPTTGVTVPYITMSTSAAYSMSSVSNGVSYFLQSFSSLTAPVYVDVTTATLRLAQNSIAPITQPPGYTCDLDPSTPAIDTQIQVPVTVPGQVQQITCRENSFTLTLQKTSGAGRTPGEGGTVTSTNNGFRCGTMCSGVSGGITYAGYTLVATPTSGFQFSGWSGDCTGTGNCVLSNVTSNKTVTASFVSDP
jgi:hypothetical protein